MSALAILRTAIDDAVVEYRQSRESDYRAAAAMLVRIAADLVERIDGRPPAKTRDIADIAARVLELPDWEPYPSADPGKIGICFDFGGVGWGPLELDDLTLADLQALARRVV